MLSKNANCIHYFYPKGAIIWFSHYEGTYTISLSHSLTPLRSTRRWRTRHLDNQADAIAYTHRLIDKLNSGRYYLFSQEDMKELMESMI